VTANDCHTAANHLRTLASAEHARLSAVRDDGSYETYRELHRLMDHLDPLDLLALAAVLDTEAMLRKVGLQSLPETPHVRVTHAGDNWSRRVPCG
jgi:hypothetical protein